MHAENLLVHKGRHGEAVEAVGEDFPQPHVEPPLALVIEPVDAVYGGALVVAPQEEEVLGVLYLVGEEEANCLEALLAAVHVVPQEQVVGTRGKPAVVEEP